MTCQLKSDRLRVRQSVEPLDQIVLTNMAVLPAVLLLPHDPAIIMQGAFFALLLIAAGAVDAQTREIPDQFCAMIFLISLIRPDSSQSLIGMFLVSVPLWILGTLIPGSVGGGDIKLLAACGAVLGPVGIAAGTMLGLTFYFVLSLFRFLYHRKRERTSAMAPWFGAGCCLAYIIQMNGG